MITLNLETNLSTPRDSRRGKILASARELSDNLDAFTDSFPETHPYAERAAQLLADLMSSLPHDPEEPQYHAAAQVAADALDDLGMLIQLSGVIAARQGTGLQFSEPNPQDDWRPAMGRKLQLVRGEVTKSVRSAACDGPALIGSIRAFQGELHKTRSQGKVHGFDMEQCDSLIATAIRALEPIRSKAA